MYEESFTSLFKAAYEEISKSKVVAIAVHKNPDGDAIGSMLGLADLIEKNLPRITVIRFSCDPVPGSMYFLAGAKKIVSTFPADADLIIGLDYGNVDRLGIPSQYLSKEVKMVTFDHHPVDRQSGYVMVIDSDCSSTAELLYLFARELELTISSDCAQCLLTGIFTDTGGFVHANTTARALSVTADLMEKGASISQIQQHVFAKPPHVLRAWGDIFSRTKLDETLKMVYASVSFSQFSGYDISQDELSGVVETLNTVEESRFAAFLLEYKEGRVKGSLRSEPFKGVDVSAIAKLLGGGGHKYASGFEVEGNVERVEEKLKEAARALLIND